MLKIEAVLRPENLEAVCEKLRRIGYPGMMVTEMAGHGRQGGLHPYWPQEMRERFIPKVRMEIILLKKDRDRVVEAILSAARTGVEGDGKIFISEIQEAIRIRTGEKGEKAVSSDRAAGRKRSGTRPERVGTAVLAREGNV